MAEVATGAEAEGSAKVKAAGSGEGTEPSSGAQHNANESGGSQQTNSVAFGSWEQPPPTNAQLLTPSLANAFGIELMNGYRYPAQPNGGRGSAHDSGNGVHSGNGANNPPARESSYGGGAPEHHAGAMAPPPGYGGFPHPGMHAPPGSQNAANAQAAAAVMAAASAMARGASGGHYASHYANLQHQYAQHYASRGGAPQGHYGADMYGRRSDGQQGMGAQQGHIDASVSFQHMMAYQAGVEHSRSFEAFKRSRDDPSALGSAPDGLGEEDHAHAVKRPRLVWTPPLHKRFVDAVSHLGIKNAVPKTIMQLMNVEGLTRENVASHLQKYRLYLKRLQGCSESTMENSPSRGEGGGSGGGSDDGAAGGPAGADGSSGNADGSGNGSGSEGNGANDGGSGEGGGGGGSSDAARDKNSSHPGQGTQGIKGPKAVARGASPDEGAGGSGNGSGEGPGDQNGEGSGDQNGGSGGSGKGEQGSGGGSGGGSDGSDGCGERPSSMERVSSGDGSADGADDAKDDQDAGNGAQNKQQTNASK